MWHGSVCRTKNLQGEPERKGREGRKEREKRGERKEGGEKGKGEESKKEIRIFLVSINNSTAGPTKISGGNQIILVLIILR